jgi:hypothetical protein
MITITPLDKIGIDERGYTFEYFHERYGRHLLCFRKAGSVSGNHYHKGISLTKNPEIIILVHGSLMLHYRNVNETGIIEVPVEGPVKIEIQPYVWHKLVSITDCSFLELNSLSEHSADTFTDR